MSHTLTYVCVQKCICEGVYTGFMLICMCGYVCMYVRRSVTSSIFCPSELELTRLLCPWDFPGKSTGVGCHFLLQGIFPTQGLNPGLLYYRQILYQLSHQRSPIHIGFPGGLSDKEPACRCRRCKRCRFDPWVGKIPWRRAQQPIPIFLHVESYKQRRLVDYSP